MSDRLRQSLLSALANAIGVFLGCILMNVYAKWTERLLMSVAVFVTTLLFHFLILQRNKSKEQ